MPGGRHNHLRSGEWPKKNRSPHLVPVMLVLIVGGALRALLRLTYEPWICGDTLTYFRLPLLIRDGKLATYTGERTPVYGLFAYGLSLGQYDHFVNIVAAQLLLGTATSLLIYAIVWQATANRWSESVAPNWG